MAGRRRVTCVPMVMGDAMALVRGEFTEEQVAAYRQAAREWRQSREAVSTRAHDGGPGTPGDGEGPMTQTLEKASEAAPRPELDWERDGNGRPRILPDPVWDDTTRQKWQAGRAWDDGTVGYTRVTTFAEALQDSSALTRWKMRRAVLGMGRRPDYVTAAAALTTRDDDRAALDDLAEKALEAAGPNAADVGTALHGFTERIDRGEELGAVPAEYEGTLAAYGRAVEHLTFLEYECRTVCDELEVAGTPDRVALCDVPDPDGVVDELRIVDTKTGRVDYSAGKFSTQLAIYAHSHLYHPGTGARTSLEEKHGRPLSTRWGIVVHVPAGAATAELLWIDLEHGWAGARHCRQVREWRQGASAGVLLSPVFARAPRPATGDGTCRGRKADGKPCGYRRKARAEGLGAQFCGRHGDQARDLARWLDENPGADPAAGVEELPQAVPLQPSFPPTVPREEQEAAAERTVATALDRAAQLAGEERCDTTELLVSACACDAHRGGMTPEEEAAAETAPVPELVAMAPVVEEPCAWCAGAGCSACQPGRPVLQESSEETTGQAFEHAPPVGTYALDPAAEVNGNPRHVSGLRTPDDARDATLHAMAGLRAQIMAARTESELLLIYQAGQAAGAWTGEHTQLAGERSAQLKAEQARERPEAALLAALETAPDGATLNRLWAAHGGSEWWTAEATRTASKRAQELSLMRP
jgi:hypothetical protein